MYDVNNMRRSARFAHPRYSAGRTLFVLILFRLPSTPALFTLIYFIFSFWDNEFSSTADYCKHEGHFLKSTSFSAIFINITENLEMPKVKKNIYILVKIYN